MTDHTGCCCTEALNDHLALKAAYWAACQALAATDGRLHETVAERDRARDTAARLEAELARGFRITAPPATLTRPDQDRRSWTWNGEVMLSDPEKLIQELGSVDPDGRSR